MNDRLDPEQRSELTRFWKSRARGERTTAVAFEHIRDDLIALGAPAVLREMAGRAVADELRHAAACMLWAEHFNGGALPPVEPHSEKPLGFAGASSQEQRVLRVIFGCCFCETVAVQLLSTLHAQIEHEALRRQNRDHLRDEVQHSRLGWALLGTLSERERHLVRHYVPEMVRLTRQLWEVSDYVEDPVLVAHGYSPPSMVAEAAERALREVIVPGLERGKVLH